MTTKRQSLEKLVKAPNFYNKPLHSQQYYRDHAPQGWDYGGFWDCLHHYQKEGRDSMGLPRYSLMSLMENDIEAKNIALMVKLGMTRSPETGAYAAEYKRVMKQGRGDLR